MNGPDAGAPPALIALDWGTTSLRAWLLGAGGEVLERQAAPRGVMQLPPGGFPQALDEVAGPWLRRWPGLRAIAAGMVGSAQGWVEAPYLPSPAGPGELARGLVAVPGGALLIVPGVAVYGGAANVMRGEETQIAGALALRADLPDPARLLLPGTHSKWVEVAGGTIGRFETYMTGELFAVLRTHSILGRLATGPEPGPEEAEAAFLRGVAAVRARGRAAPLIFSARALALTGGLQPSLTLEYLSGLLIGEELASALAEGPPPDALIGDPALCARYRLALSSFGVAAVPEIEEAALAGLWSIAVRAGIVAATDRKPR